MRTKAQELEIVEAAILKLTPESYCGPALAELLPALEADMRSDIRPDLRAERDRLRESVEAWRSAGTEAHIKVEELKAVQEQLEAKIAVCRRELRDIRARALRLAEVADA